MLTIDQHLKLDAAAIKSPNLCDHFDADDLQAIGNECKGGYEQDLQSRTRWMERNEAGMDLALQIQKDKSFPWPGSANVAFPLVTIAAMQFHARAYPALVGSSRVVKCEVFGDDPTGTKAARSERVSTHMSWQLLYEDRPWEEQEDKAILNLAIIGTCFKKSYYSASLGHNVSELVLAKDLVLNYWAKSVEDCPRKTHRIPKFRNDIHEAVVRGVWRDCLEEAWYTAPQTPPMTPAGNQQDNRQGTAPPPASDVSAITFGEQHVAMDLDGDGYAEPYIITFELLSGYVVRIVARFSSEKTIQRMAAGTYAGKIIRIEAEEYFTKKSFIPSPDGGIYDIGFGVFLGPLNESVNSLINMLMDSGTMQTTGGGWLGRGAKMRSGTTTFAPFEWKRVDASGDDLRKSIVPNVVAQPSEVLFKLLGLLIEYTSRVAGTVDITVGENPGQNTPAQTTQTMVEMGQKIYSAIFKRCWRSSKEEFRKLYKLNGIYLPVGAPLVGGATREDYQGGEDLIAPVADPHVTSDSQRLQLALTLKQAAMSTPGYNRDAVEVKFLKALKIDDVKAVFPGTAGQPPPKDPKVALQEAKDAGAMQRLQMQLQADQQAGAAALMEDQRLNNAKIVMLMAQADDFSASAETEADYAQVAAINAQISLAKHENDSLAARIEALLTAAKIRSDHAIGMKKAMAKPAGASK